MTSSRTILLAATLTTSLIAAAPAIADMFVWKDLSTGRTRMSNIPPLFLREPPQGRPAPKVDVIRERKVIDAATAFANPQAPARPSEQQLAKGKPAPAAKPEAKPVENEDNDEDK